LGVKSKGEIDMSVDPSGITESVTAGLNVTGKVLDIVKQKDEQLNKPNIQENVEAQKNANAAAERDKEVVAELAEAQKKAGEGK
jgi:hypothetical protein